MHILKLIYSTIDRYMGADQGEALRKRVIITFLVHEFWSSVCVSTGSQSSWSCLANLFTWLYLFEIVASTTYYILLELYVLNSIDVDTLYKSTQWFSIKMKNYYFHSFYGYRNRVAGWKSYYWNEYSSREEYMVLLNVCGRNLRRQISSRR